MKTKIEKYEDGNKERILDKDLQDNEDCEMIMIKEPKLIKKFTQVLSKWFNIN